MHPSIRLLRRLALPVALVFVVSTAAAQSGPASQTRPASQGGLAPGVTREQMWFAPTAEDWKKPCLITWQRSYEDAVAISNETKKAILVCINMDGEIASEHYAGVRYRQPEIAKLYEPYVCVIASVYRHNPRDYDDEGRRIVCPRFGTVTCGEHIAIEPGLFEKFMDDRRIAPRHIGVELDKKEMFDIFYAWDTDTIFNGLKKGIEGRPAPPPLVKGDRGMVERVASRDQEDRIAVEIAYAKGDRAQRRALLEAAAAHPDVAQVDLLRLAITGMDLELAKVARGALSKVNTEGAIDVIAQALRVPLEPAEREKLVSALAKIGETSPRAKTLATVYQGLQRESDAVDMESWSRALAGADAKAPSIDNYVLESKLEDGTRAARTRPDDAEARLLLAESTIAYVAQLSTKPKNARVFYQDAYRAATEAEKLGASGWRVNAAAAIAAYYLGNLEEARTRSEAAVKGMPKEALGWNAMVVLALFAEQRQHSIAKAMREKKPWPPEWLTDVNAAYAVLSKHPLGTDVQVAAHVDFLRQLGAPAQAWNALDAGLARFPDSWVLHARLRGRILEEKGVAGLEPAYELRLSAKDASKNLEWYAGYASIVAAEFHRRAAHPNEALAAYERALAHFGKAITNNPETRDTSDHYVALALAGRARVEYERGDYDQALADVLASFERKPDAAASEDGLRHTPVSTAKILRERCVALKKDAIVASIDAALAKLDPKMLQLPAYETEIPASRPGRGPRGPDGR